MTCRNSDSTERVLPQRSPNIFELQYPICEPWCWRIYQHVPEQIHPILQVNIQASWSIWVWICLTIVNISGYSSWLRWHFSSFPQWLHKKWVYRTFSDTKHTKSGPPVTSWFIIPSNSGSKYHKPSLSIVFVVLNQLSYHKLSFGGPTLYYSVTIPY